MRRNPSRLLVLTAIIAVLLAVSPASFAGAQEGERQTSGSPGILTPDYPYLAPDVLAFRDQSARYLSGRVSLIAQGLDANAETVAEGRTGPVASAQGAPDSQGGVLVPYRDPSARFSRNILIPTDFSALPLQTEPHLAVDPLDPDHIVAGMIDYNFPGTTMYVTYDGGVTWEGPAVIKRPREELGAGGDPVLAFDREGSVYSTFISLDIEEFTVGNLLGSAVVSSMALSSSTDGGFTWTQGTPAVRSGVTSEFEIDTLGRTRGTISLGFLDKPWLAVGPNPDDPDSDIIYISYTHFNTTYRIRYTDELAFLSDPVLQTTIEVVSSEDGGISWSDPVIVSPIIRQVFEFGGAEQVTLQDNPEALQSPDAVPGGQVIESLKRIVQGSYVATHDDGTVYVSWMDSSDDGPFEGLAQMYVAKSEDGGDTFEDGRQAASYLELGFSPRSSFYRFWGSAFSRIAVGPNEELYVAFSAAPSGDPSDDADVMFIRSMDEGRTWSRPPLRINDDRTSGIQFFPSIDVSPDGKVHIMWADTRDDPGIDLRYHIYYAVSEDNGESFSINSRVTDSASNPNFGFPGGQFIGDYMGIAATDEDVYLVWPDTRLGEFQGTNQKIGFARMRQMPSPSIFLSPARGASATTVTIQGFNFQADQDIFILVSGVLVSTIESNDEGRFTTQLFFPTAGEGPQSVAVFDASGNSATASFYNEFGFDNLQETAADIADIKAALSSDTLATIQEALERIESGETDGDDASGGCGTGNATADMALVGLIALGIIGAAQLNARRRRRANNSDEASQMRNFRFRLPLILSFVLITGLVAGGGAALAQSGDDYRPPHDLPGPAVDTLHYRSFNVDLAPQEIQRDEMDMYIFNLKTDAAQALRGDDSIELYEAPASTISLILNPAPAPEGQLNPFSLPEVRRAVQHLVNREFITQEIYKGLARPMQTHVNPFDFDYTVVAEMLARQDLSYDPERARAAIADAMMAAGATMVDGAWNYNDEPIRLRFIIRVEDERREVGDLIRAELEQAGFLIAPIYHQFAPAILTVYSTDPQLFEWHAYTEGWGRGAAERYDSATINQMTAPWLGSMPGWQETGFWQYENARIDDLGQRIFRGDFNDREERDALYQEVTRLSVEESVRVWLATILTTFPANSNIHGVTQDVAAGPKLQWTFREAYVPDQDTLTVGHLWVWTERSTWNPVSGFGDVYSADVWRNLADPAMTRHPFTGLPIPMRADYEVETAGPGAKMSVPSDVQRWDADAGEWASVGDGVEATSKVTFDYSKFFQAPWHHGEQITMADLVFDIYQTFDMVYGPEKSQVEFAISTTAKPLLDTVRGFRVLDENRIEVYVDYWHFVDDYIAEYAVPGGMTMPWEVLAAMDDVVFNQRRAAYSDTSAQRFGVPWLSLVQDRDARTVDRALGQFERDGFVPMAALTIGGQALVTEQEALERYRAAQAWFDERSLMVISNGPFYLERFDPPAQFAELKAFRDENYPFKPGDWHFGAAEPISIETGSVGSIVIGQDFSVGSVVDGPGNLGVRYVWSDPATGNVVKTGEADIAESDPPQAFVRLSAGETAALVPGLYRLSITAYSDQLSTVSERVLTVEASTTGTATGDDGTTTTPTNGEDEDNGAGGCFAGAGSADLLLLGGLLAGLVGISRRRRN